MIINKYNEEKIKNLIFYFILKYKNKVKNDISHLFLYKSISFFEFELLEKFGKLPLGLIYLAKEKGPVPKEIYIKKSKYRNTDFYEFNDTSKTIVLKRKHKPNLDYFSYYEKEKMKDIVNRYYKKDIDDDYISNESHDKIKAWQIAFNNNEEEINFDYVFPNINNKKDEDLSSAENKYLMIKAFERLSK